MSRRISIAIFVALCFVSSASAFKAEDFKVRKVFRLNLFSLYTFTLGQFSTCSRAPNQYLLQKCEDASFCSRLRGNESDAFAIDSGTVVIDGPHVKATITNRQHPASSFSFRLTSYDNGIVRLHIDEPNAQPPRFQVPDVLLASLPAKESAWTVAKKTATKVRLSKQEDPSITIELRFSPIKILIARNGMSLITWNDANQFLMEHRRTKQEGDPEGWWAENFKTHHDSKPRGPEAMSWDVTFHGSNHVYGLPERASPFSLPPTRSAENKTILSEPYRLYNLDVFEYLSNSPFGLYGSIPLLWALHKGEGSSAASSSVSGLFWLNSAEMYVDIEKPVSLSSNSPSELQVKSQWMAESGVVDLFFLLGPSPVDASVQYASLTGGSALPQLFALGYHQCRWNYKDEEDVSNVDSGFDKHQIPYDVLWLDIEHTDGKRYFTWDSSHFPNPVAMQDDIASRGRKMVTIVDPHIKRDTEYRIFAEAQEKGYFVKDRDGKDFDGWCWPGSSSYLDYISPTVRSWWADQFSLGKYNGSTPNLYIWNDMNEPSVFNGPEITMHKDSRHAENVEHRDVHNAYGYYYHMATAEGLKRRGLAEAGADGDRPFVLSRAFFAGSQRVGAIWTGDNAAEWAHLEVSVPMLLSIGLSGLPFSGADVGGFFGNPDAELMTRWYQVGAFYPFFRGHAHLESKRREPWLFGEETTANIREAIRQRYLMLPYIYTLFAQANASGIPVMRPLWYEFPELAAQDVLAAEDHLFMLGPAILVAPVLRQGETSVRILLPTGARWYDGIDGDMVKMPNDNNHPVAAFEGEAPLDTIRTFIRGGSIIPLKERARRSSKAMETDPITLIVALNASGQAHGELYVDDGKSYAFQRRGHYIHVSLDFTADGRLRCTSNSPKNKRKSTKLTDRFASSLIDRIVILGLPQTSTPSLSASASTGSTGGWTVKHDDKVLEASLGPLFLKPGLPDAGLVVRRTQLPISQDWTLKFVKQTATA